MKKNLYFVALAALSFSLFSCGSDDNEPTPPPTLGFEIEYMTAEKGIHIIMII